MIGGRTWQGGRAADETLPVGPAIGVREHDVTAPDRGSGWRRVWVSWITANTAVLD